MNYQEFTERYQYDPRKDYLDQGGFSTVYKAWDKHTSKYVVVKIASVDGKKEIDTLRKEVDYVRDCGTNDNIACYVHSFRHEGPTSTTDYAIMEYYEEGDLTKVNLSKLSLSDKKDILKGILNGLAHIHQKKITHKDIKPRNILLEKKDGHWIPKITDFGLARMAKIDRSMISNTNAGKTLAYAAPEIINDKPYNTNADLWSLGATAYYLMIGKAPFTSNKTGNAREAEISKKIIDGEIPEAINSIDEPFQNLIKACLYPDAKYRIQTAKKAFDVLESKIIWSAPTIESIPEFDPDITGGRLLKRKPLEMPIRVEQQLWWQGKRMYMSLIALLFLVALVSWQMGSNTDNTGEKMGSNISIASTSNNGGEEKPNNSTTKNTPPISSEKTSQVDKKSETANKQAVDGSNVKVTEKEKNSDKQGVLENKMQKKVHPEEIPPLKKVSSLEEYNPFFKGECKSGEKLSLNKPLTPVCKNGLIGFLNKKGEEVIKCTYSELHGANFWEGNAILKNKNGQWGMIDTTGDIMIPFTHNSPLEVEEIAQQ